jgi:hypothetical protein
MRKKILFEFFMPFNQNFHTKYYKKKTAFKYIDLPWIY